jgi:outer membrane protein assembly factor BamB
VAKWVRAAGGTGDYLDVDDLAAPEGDDRVYAASSKAGVVVLEAATGNPVWTAPLPGANHVLVDGPRVYASGKSAIAAFGRTDGKLLWKTSLGNDKYATRASTTGGLLLLAIERGPLVAVDALTGRTRGAFNPGSGFSASPLVIPGAAFAISNAGVLFSLGLLP